MKNEPLEPEATQLAGLIDYQAGSVVSRQLLKTEHGNVTLFAFDKGEALSEHTSPFDALVQVLDGRAEMMVSRRPHLLKTGQAILMPANRPHAVKAVERFKMLLTLLRS